MQTAWGRIFHRDLPLYVTSYDLLKSLALILMVVDHIGFYLLNDLDVLRALGRLSVPIWFFLIGYARSRGDIVKLLVGGALCQLVAWYYGEVWYYLNVLTVFAFARLTIDKVMDYTLRSWVHVLGVSMVMLLFYGLSEALFMYGTAGYALVMFGFMARRRGEWWSSRALQGYFCAGTFVLYFLYNYTFFEPMKGSLPLFLLVTLGSVAAWALCYCFKPMVFSKSNSFDKVAPVLKFMGRYTFEFYVIHFIALHVLRAVIA